MGAARGWQPGVAIVTGASAGLGRAFAIELARAATAVTVMARRRTELEETARLVRDEGVRCELVVGDVTEPGIAESTVAHTEATLGPVDLLVANAGVLGLGAIAEIDPSLWRRVIDVNLVAPMLWDRAVLAGMRVRRRGRIINVTSVASPNPQPYGSAYTAAKAGLNQLTKSLAAEVADDGIAVFALSPAAHTDMGRELYENDVMPEKQRAGLRAYMTTDPDALMQRSLELFRFVAAGGADALSGQYVGVHMGRSETPDDLRARVAALATT